MTIFLLIAGAITGYFSQINFEPYELSVQVQANRSSFPDSFYEEFNWRSFKEWEETHKVIDLYNPDYGLLNAAVFYVTNEQREKKHKPVFKFSSALRDAAFSHSQQMVERKFYNHRNSKRKEFRYPHNRIKYYGGNFEYTAENIADTRVLAIRTGAEFRTTKADKGFHYVGNNEEEINPFTYLAFAENVVKGWMNSPPHRANILSKNVTHLGCGVMIDVHSFGPNRIPRAKSTQNFGGM